MKKLKPKELEFVNNYISSNYNGAASYRKTFHTTNDNVAKSEAWALIRRPHIRKAIEQSEQSFRSLARTMQMDRRSILLEIKKVIDSGNARHKLAGIGMLAKLCGHFSPQKQDINLEFGSTFDPDILDLPAEKIKERIIQELAN
ncbi:hypothetical protein K8R32_03140 [bacterium]|nr:hypothetical protein [bacterium]